MTYEPRWDIDRKLGEEAERYVDEVFGWACDHDRHLHVEVKHKRYDDDWFYVELLHRPPGAAAYRPSGLNVTEAELFAVSIADTGVVMIFPTPLLRAVIRAEPMLGRPKAETDGSCPTEGRLLRLATVLNYARQQWEALA